MIFKEFEPTYKDIELMINHWNEEYLTEEQMFVMATEFPQVQSYDDIVKEYGDYEVASIKDFEDTKTTSVILWGKGA